MIKKKLEVKLIHGLHARPVAHIVKKLQNLDLSDSVIEHNGIIASCKSIIEVLTLGAAHGAQLVIKVAGRDEDKAIKVIEDVVGSEYWEDITG